ncbi:SIS domain-containing protein [Actibacterium sp. 188UL27-1]|uniref:KpsF/GutQ family sugar-phosphate isomerase n=1 Tax=Actibacterium sp. 188UL27-1 TaxID=2786961 RepID=UPI00195813C3|nr:KpsF/GutQ family sugar-phosphate isomerase [Actibacterium sp. 188UL27-1]MBM7067134.1 KpsF/GutQ family sugar-phosphate isomerase [Actibacterium sp. 188UL27-1]
MAPDPDALLTTGRAVIARETEALGALAEALDHRFAKAVDLILQARGRVIVSGMGKSGHVARKVAATFASTGTPAHFVHPAEAAHGDLGMLAAGDVVLLLSKSGETPELAPMIGYTRRFGIPLIAVADNPGSTLMGAADVNLVLPQVAEACGTGIVPTSSTTMCLALGDALAVALMTHRRFTPENFREFHPGGKLGAQLSRVEDLMHTGDKLPFAPTGTMMGEALLTMSEKSFGVVGVLSDDGRLSGVVTDGDLRRHMGTLMQMTVDEVMTTTPKVIGPGALAEEAVALMTETPPRVTCLFVIEPDSNQRPVGLLHIHDCLRIGLG